MRTLGLVLIAALGCAAAHADDARFVFSEFDLGAARAKQGGGAALGPHLLYLPHYELRFGDRSASLGIEVGAANVHDRGRSDFAAAQYGAYQAFTPIKNLELRLSAGIQRWDNTRETSVYVQGEGRVLLDHPDRHILKGLYGFYGYVANHRRTEVAGGGFVLHWPTRAVPKTAPPVATTPPAPDLAPPLPIEFVQPNTPEHVVVVAPASVVSPEAAPAPEVVAAATPPPETEWINAVSSGTYNPNSVYFGQEYRAKLQTVAEALLKSPNLRLTITGFAESSETQPAELARRRADGVKAWLVTAGVGADRLTSVAHADQKPSAVGEVDRRVELRVTSADAPAVPLK